MTGQLDVVVGMQYGDEGKGSTCAMLNSVHRYDFGVRVGGSQAEHRFNIGEKKFRCRVLPSVCCVDPSIIAVLGGGHVIRKDILWQECETYGYPKEVVLIDRNACVVKLEDRRKSQTNKGNGGYGMGISSALARKIQRRRTYGIAMADRGMVEKCIIVRASRSIHSMLIDGLYGVVEGSQGALLSLNHGNYPYVTSQDVNAPAIMGSIGVSTEFIHDIYGVVRLFPMKVSGTKDSFYGEEIDFDVIEKECGTKIPEYRRYQANEDGSFGPKERIARFSTRELISGLIQNAPTFIVLTHCDWVHGEKVDNIMDSIQVCSERVLGRKVSFILRHGEDINDWNPVR